MENIGRLREFVRGVTQLVGRHGAEAPGPGQGSALVRAALPQQFCDALVAGRLGQR